MQNFEPGDEVTFMVSNLRGKVLHRIDRLQLMIEIEDGFEIPAFINELVLVKKNKENKEELNPDDSSKTNNNKPEEIRTFSHSGLAAQKGLFLGFSLQNDKKSQKAQVHCFFINSTKDTMLFTVFAGSGILYKGLAKGEAEPGKALQISTFLLDDSENFKNWNIQVLNFSRLPNALPQPLNLNFKFKEANLLKSNHELPLLGLNGWLVPLEDQDKEKGNKQIQNVLADEPKFSTNDGNGFVKVEHVSDIVDLHIDTIIGKEKKADKGNDKPLADGEALQLQMQHFINALEKAYAFGLEKITFIHGIGGGVLKNKIREHLKKQEFVAKILDADTKKFGHGATEVYLKLR